MDTDVSGGQYRAAHEGENVILGHEIWNKNQTYTANVLTTYHE